MSTINFAKKEINCKIVYYGCALSGKTTNLQYIHQHIASDTRSNMVSLNTKGDRTLFFDFLPLTTGSIEGFKTRFQLYTVPGQVIYNATRKLVLQGVDGVVFVADSQISRLQMNKESFQNLKENLAEMHLALDRVPYLLTYNKRDLDDIAPTPFLNYLLNREKNKVPAIETIATNGYGVFKALNTISKMVLVKLITELKEQKIKGK
ncbi:MAG: GTP-binding protein [Candidatus Zixiibacteriota bacterium]